MSHAATGVQDTTANPVQLRWDAKVYRAAAGTVEEMESKG